MSWPPPWSARNTESACRAADRHDESVRGTRAMEPQEDEDGFVRLENYRIYGMVWIAEGRDTDGEPLSWLHGKAS